MAENLASPELSVVLPAWNEWRNLRELVPRLLSISAVGEVIVIDDASADIDEQAWTKEPFFSSPRFRRIRNEIQLGLAASVYQGISAAKLPLVLVRDSDWNHDIEDTEKLLDALRTGAGLGVASRYREGGEGHGRVNDLFSRGVNFFLRRYCATITDWTHGYFLVRRELLNGLPDDWIFRGRGEYVARLFRALLKKNPQLIVREIPTRVEERGHGRSTTSIFRHGIPYLRVLLEKVPPSEVETKLVREAAKSWASHGGGVKGSGHSAPGFRARKALLAEEEIGFPALDLGCGNGAFTFSLLNDGEVDGVDLSSEALQLAKRFPYRRLLAADLAVEFPQIDGERYSTFFCLEVAQYLSARTLSQVFRFSEQCARSPGARFFCLMPNRSSYLHRIRRRLGLGKEDYQTATDMAFLAAVASGAGWRLQRLKGAPWGARRATSESARGASPWATHLLAVFEKSGG